MELGKIWYAEGRLFKSFKNGKVHELLALSLCNGHHYRTVGINYKSHYVHRVVWEMFNGPIPKEMVIDHINGVTTDNRIENLRCVSQTRNMLNKNNAQRCDNSSGVRGVAKHDSHQGRSIGWDARITVGGNTRRRWFKSFEEAKQMRLQWEKELGL